MAESMLSAIMIQSGGNVHRISLRRHVLRCGAAKTRINFKKSIRLRPPEAVGREVLVEPAHEKEGDGWRAGYDEGRGSKTSYLITADDAGSIH
jgi:hypothetical protein